MTEKQYCGRIAPFLAVIPSEVEGSRREIFKVTSAGSFDFAMLASLGMTNKEYRGRIAPSPTGLLHIGHAITFWRAQERACAAGGKLVLRIEDLDRDRCRREFADAIIEDLHWFGLDWDEGPDIGGPFAPYIQSQRRSRYLEAWEKLRLGGFIYPCKCSRKDVAEASLAPHDENEEPIYPGTCRPGHPRSRAHLPAMICSCRCLSGRPRGRFCRQ